MRVPALLFDRTDRRAPVLRQLLRATGALCGRPFGHLNDLAMVDHRPCGSSGPICADLAKISRRPLGLSRMSSLRIELAGRGPRGASSHSITSSASASSLSVIVMPRRPLACQATERRNGTRGPPYWAAKQ
jgi:hypothetical protein